MTGALVPRVLVVVCDSWGVGDAPDAAAYGDEGSDTLANTAGAVGGIRAPNLASLGLGSLTSIRGVDAAAAPGTAHGRATERSAGKDTTTGHWEMMGIRLDEPFPLYPDGFPADLIEAFERGIGRPVLGNRPASGTEIIAELGEEHLRTGSPIVYTSGDSVFQIAAHKDVVGLAQLYEWSRTARRLLTGPHNIGRVIARPFEGRPGAFVRSPERRDFSVPPPGPTVLDRLQEAGVAVLGVGKIQDIFSGQGISEGRYSDSNDHGVDLTLEYLRRPGPAFVFTNLVDFDSKYGHRNDPDGYAACIEAFDRRLPELIDRPRRGRAVAHRRPRVRPHHSADRPFARADPAPGRRAPGRTVPTSARGIRSPISDRRWRICSGPTGRDSRDESFVDLLGIEGSS